MVPVQGRPQESAALVASIVGRLRASSDPELDGIVVGLPKRLNGEETDQTPLVRQFVSALSALVALPVDLQDERLTSVEAESRLAEREHDWRRRKMLIDAESASIM
jgi:putative Holliday junction resolvase